MVIDPLRRSKLEPVYEGPYKVVKRSKNGAYMLLDNDNQLIQVRPLSDEIGLSARGSA